MAERTPMVKVDGYWRELPAGDTVAGASGGGWTVSAKTADYTVLAADSNTIFTNQGASGTVRFTLPVNAGLTAGRHSYKFIAVEPYPIEIIMGQGKLYFCAYDSTSFEVTDVNFASSIGQVGDRMDVDFLAASKWSGINNGRWYV